MADKYFYDFYQIPATGVTEPDLAGARDGVDVSLRRPVDMKMSNFGALNVGARLASDYTRTNTMAFMAKGNSEDWSVITEDTGVGSNVASRSMNVNHNPHVWGDSIKFVRDDQFIRMTMSNDNEGAQIDPPKFDVMDSKERTAEGMLIADTAAGTTLNWPTEGWRSLGGKYDFEKAYVG
jgi:hypothetical protein